MNETRQEIRVSPVTLFTLSVPGEQTYTMVPIDGRFLVRGSNSTTTSSPLLVTDVGLSFWGGIDPETGTIIDTSHPLVGKNVTDKIFCLPSGRGSCTASQVLLELILRGKAPKAIVLRDTDGLVCVGAIIADEIFHHDPLPDIICVGENGFESLLSARDEATQGSISLSGRLQLGEELESEDEKGSDTTTDLVLSESEERMLDNCGTEAERMAHRVIFRYAHLTGCHSYVSISQSHIDGCTYIGIGGLDFVRKLVRSQGQVKVPTTLNSMSTDRKRWQVLGVPKEYATNAIALGEAYLDLGCQNSFTCAPYLLQNPPKPGQDIAWGESNAVVYANTVLGAHTEKYADYLDICCAIAGIAPAVGVHLAENRRPSVTIDATAVLSELLSTSDDDMDIDLLFPTLGYLCGSLSDGKVPILLGLSGATVHTDQLKAFCAAFGTTAASPLIHIAGITPEVLDTEVVDEYVTGCGKNVKTVAKEDLERTFRLLDESDANGAIDLVAIGNPHLSVSECSSLVSTIQSGGGETRHADTRIIACMSRSVHSQVKQEEIKSLEDFGIEFVFDTCWCMLLDEPVIPEKKNATILTNSGKYAHYGPALTNRSFRFGSMSDCIEAARTGMYPKRNYDGATPWLKRQTRSLSTVATLSKTLRTALRHFR